MTRPRGMALLAAAILLGGCRFWYKPVPVANAIGDEETVLAGDTVNVYRDTRFEVYGPSSEAVYDGYEQLNRAYRAFGRYFGVSAPRVAVVLSRDTARTLDDATRRGFRERGVVLVEYVRPANFRSPSRYGAIGYGGVVWPIAPTAARVMLARHADATDGDGAQPDAVVLERFPVWYRAAMMHLLGDAGSRGRDLEYVREKRASWFPLRELLAMVRPAAGDTLLDPSRRDEADDMSRLVAAQASTFARFLVVTEGPDVMGRLARGYLAQRTLDEMIREFRRAPRTLPELEQRWRHWVDAEVN